MKKIISFAFACTFLMTGIISASAATQYPAEGGHWNYGVGTTGTYSDYRHDQRDHVATVKKESSKNQDTAGPREWAKARLWVYSGATCYYGLL